MATTITLNTQADWTRSINGQARLSQNGNVVAQSFRLPVSTDSLDPQKQTSIVTSVDLWFSSVDTRKVYNQVSVEIREMKNGYPGAIDSIIVTSEVVKLATANAVATPTTSNGTNFKMKRPVKLQANKEYAIVVKSPSTNTTLLVANRGEALVSDTGIHTQPTNVGSSKGSMFVSENASTWKVFLNSDLTFRVKRAKFSTAQASIQLQNAIKSDDYYLADIGAYSDGLAIETFENSYYVKVIHPNHGMNYFGAQVALQGFVAAASYNGILGSALNGTHTVEFATLNSYFIRATTATASGKPAIPKFDVFASQSLVFDELQTNIPVTKEEAEEVGVTVKTEQTNSVKLAVNSNTIGNTLQAATVTDSVITVPLNKKITFDTPKVVKDLTNSSKNDLVITLTLDSANSYTSPFFKKDDGINPIVYRNVVGDVLVDSDVEGLTTTTLTLADSDLSTQQQFASYQAGVQSLKEHSAYITNQIDLELPADGLTVIFDADMEPNSKVLASYKARGLGDDTPFEDLEWIDFANAQQINELNYGPFSSGPDLQNFTMRVTAPFEFSSYKLRLRLVAENEAQTPKVSSLRIIADL